MSDTGRFAEGLISPQIKRLERIVTQLDDSREPMICTKCGVERGIFQACLLDGCPTLIRENGVVRELT